MGRAVDSAVLVGRAAPVAVRVVAEVADKEPTLLHQQPDFIGKLQVLFPFAEGDFLHWCALTAVASRFLEPGGSRVVSSSLLTQVWKDSGSAEIFVSERVDSVTETVGESH